MRTMWLSFGAIVAVIGAACAAGEDNTDVQVASETTLPQCNPGPPVEQQKLPPEEPNTEHDVRNDGSIIHGSTSSGGSANTNTGASGGAAGNGSGQKSTAPGGANSDQPCAQPNTSSSGGSSSSSGATR